MRPARIMITFTTFVVALGAFAPVALAHTANGGRGWWGESTDPVITNAMFLTIAFFPVFITVASIVQWRLDKRKHAREDAARARELSADWRGGW
jgi:hypothetical protein